MTGSLRIDEGVWRDLVPYTLARLVRTYGSDQFDLCEDAVQEALLEAHLQWPMRPPDDPRAWMIAVSKRRYVDRVRSEARRRQREARVAMLESPLDPTPVESDDALLLLNLCCDPALPRSGQVALTLRAVAGLTTRQIANVYQLPEATIAQRITRARRRVAEVQHTFSPPGVTGVRLGQVLEVLYVTLTEAHHTKSGEPVRDAHLAAEAIHLVRLLRQAVPNSTEVAGLLALMVLTEARHPARVDGLDRLVALDEQDRGLWNRPLIDEGLAVLDEVAPGATPGPYLLQACIAALHAQATDTESTDWVEVHALYTVLDIQTGGRNPTISLNRIVAQAMIEGADAALITLEDLARDHPSLPRVVWVRAHLLERSGCPDQAVAAYRAAIAATVNVAEQRYLRMQLQRIVGGSTSAGTG